MLNVGVIIGERYEVVSRIGSGGMADVYKAKDHKLNRFVAMKVLKPEFSADTNFIRKFQREAQAAAGLAHPNVVNVFDVGEDHGVNYIVMELVEGITLKEYISKKGRLTVKEATSIAIQVSMGLEAAHNRNIVHRDIKPQNIIISTDGKVKVTDFGIARVATSNTISTNAMGSVHYSSPEQVRGGYSDFKSDIYSLGITMYEMVTGRVPFDGDTTVAIAIKHLQDEMVPPSKYVPDLPRSLEEIILKCTQKSPDRRYSTLAELINDLKHSLIDPDGNFVNISPLSNHAQTVMITPEEMKEIQESTGGYSQDSGYGGEDQDEEDYNEDDEDDEEDEEEDDGKGGLNTNLGRVMTIGSLLIGAVAICILIYLVASAAGIIGGTGKSNQEQTQQEETKTVTVPSLTNMTEDVAQTTLKGMGLDFQKGGEEASDTVPEGQVCRQSPAAGTEVEADNTTVVYYISTGAAEENNEVETVTVPSLTNMTEDVAQTTLHGKGLGFQKGGEEASDTVPEGQVCRQDPAAGTEVEINTTIVYYISTGPEEEETVTIPAGLTGQTLSQVQSQLQSLGLNFTVEQEASSDVAVGNVISLSPEEGSVVPAGSSVTVTVSIGEGDTNMTTVPNVRGYAEDTAEEIVKNAGLIPSVKYGYMSGTGVGYGEVYDMSPQADQRIEEGSVITLWVLEEEEGTDGTDGTDETYETDGTDGTDTSENGETVYSEN
ncbi:MAG TPA: Stk1 family PASTA domain-containing Ser/Thr kinase [Candidatus Blautia stercoripullorum]|uniref:non-specific serine/threonine protein kinase n=1 Tax=Candidatus Blautia stercoripullorum TaxID=2838502 RepID=A0A9D2RDT6_9FIRM|nr:Stk1 family PASTA domain-containing Ser/Thr kinase [Candidatus Blautia stercoripullorum]